MNPRTKAALYQHLDSEMAWRIKEVHTLCRAVAIAEGKASDVHIRAGVALLYAHWEGFIKGAANAYVSYIAHRADLNEELQACFVALGMRSTLSDAFASPKPAFSVAVVDYLLATMGKPSSLPRKEAISAQDNLNFDVLKNICSWIGLDVSRYEPRSVLIDERLLKSRNGIAHGDRLMVDSAGYYELVEKVLEMMRWFKTDIENAAATESFLRKNAAP